jgi:hypothetical protein
MASDTFPVSFDLMLCHFLQDALLSIDQFGIKRIMAYHIGIKVAEQHKAKER